MSLCILNVSYSLAEVGSDAAGGAEQVLSALDSALVRGGHGSVVVAPEGSVTEGALVPTPRPRSRIDGAARAAAQAAHRHAIGEALARWSVDVVHMHGIDFDRYLPPPGVPVLVTLHLPPGWYAAGALTPTRPRTFLHCVSASQRRACPGEADLLPVIENGIALERFRPSTRKRRFALALGRVCPEKGFHLALDAAARSRVPLIVAGHVAGFSEHERYFREEIVPRLGNHSRFAGPVGFARKRRLLAGARCVLVPSLAPETSSLVAMEALASGTPVIAFPSGALSDIVEHGATGFLVRDVEEMADAIEAAESIDPRACRSAAEERFSGDRMARQYFALYERLACEGEGRETRVASRYAPLEVEPALG